MNKERYNQIIDEVYENYTNYPLATIHDHRTNILYQNIDKGWCMLNGRSMVSPHPTRHLTKEEFINKCKTDSEFSEKWGLQIEERELSLVEMIKLAKYENAEELIKTRKENIQQISERLSNDNIPTKLITVKYKNETIESYE